MLLVDCDVENRMPRFTVHMTHVRRIAATTTVAAVAVVCITRLIQNTSEAEGHLNANVLAPLFCLWPRKLPPCMRSPVSTADRY